MVIKHQRFVLIYFDVQDKKNWQQHILELWISLPIFCEQDISFMISVHTSTWLPTDLPIIGHAIYTAPDWPMLHWPYSQNGCRLTYTSLTILSKWLQTDLYFIDHTLRMAANWPVLHWPCSLPSGNSWRPPGSGFCSVSCLQCTPQTSRMCRSSWWRVSWSSQPNTHTPQFLSLPIA